MRTMKELSNKSGKNKYKYLLELDLTMEAHLEAIEIVSDYQKKHGCGVKSAILSIIHASASESVEYVEKRYVPTKEIISVKETEEPKVEEPYKEETIKDPKIEDKKATIFKSRYSSQ